MNSILLTQVLFGFLLSLLGVASLAMLRDAPVRLRFWLSIISMAGVLIPLPLVLGIFSGSGDVSNAISREFAVIVQSTSSHVGTTDLNPFVLVLLVALGLVFTVFHRTRSTLQDLRSRSVVFNRPEEITNPEWQALVAGLSVYRVRESSLVATSGYLKPIIWIGDELTDPDHLKCALRHERQHIHSGHQYLLLLIVLLERFQWWNPLVWKLGALARDYMEYDCDAQCQRILGQENYLDALAKIALSASKGKNPLQMSFGSGKNMIQRIEELRMNTRLRVQHAIVMVIAAFLGATTAVVASDAPTLSQNAGTTTLETCQQLLPGDGHYELTIVQKGNSRDGGQVSVRLSNDGSKEWDVPPPELMSYLECIAVIVGIEEGEEGWPSS